MRDRSACGGWVPGTVEALDGALGSVEMSEAHKPESDQQTNPARGEPIEIPVPKRGEVMDFLEKTARLRDPDRSVSQPLEDQ